MALMATISLFVGGGVVALICKAQGAVLGEWSWGGSADNKKGGVSICLFDRKLEIV